MRYEMADAFRNSRLRLAIGTAVVSKLSGALIQLAILPIALASLGQERFAAFLALTAFAAWISPLSIGLLPALTRELSAASAAGDETQQRTMFAAAFWFTFVVGMAILLIAATAALVWDPRHALGLGADISGHEARIGLFVAMGVVAVHFFANLSQAVRSGFQENYISNLLSAIANVVSFLAVLALRGREPQVALFILAAYAPMTLFMLADCGAILLRRRHLWPPQIGNDRRTTIRQLLGTSFVTWAQQLKSFLSAFATIVIVSRYFDAADTAFFGAMMRVTMLGYGVISMIIWPLVPALTDSVQRGDASWASRACLRAGVIVFVSSAAGGTIIAIFGPVLVPLWLGDNLHISKELALGFGLFFLVWNCNFTAFNINLALGKSGPLAWAILGEIFLAYLLIILLIPYCGASGVVLALGLAGLVFNFWWLPIRAAIRISSMRAN